MRALLVGNTVFMQGAWALQTTALLEYGVLEHDVLASLIWKNDAQ